MIKKALIFGVTGQDGSYLSELLLEKNYEVHGVIRRASNFNTERIEHILDNKNFHFHYGDVTDSNNVNELVSRIKPTEIYNLAAQSHVKVSFELPHYTGQVDALGTLNILEAVKNHSAQTRVYQASTSELYGKVQEIPQKETTPFYPRSPYGVAKLYGFWITKNYRESYDLFACNGILFNHESERRGKTFVTRKITVGLSRIKNGVKSTPLVMGNLDSKRDWGYAPEYVEGMWRVLQADKADDYVLATNETHTVREFIEEACFYLGWDLEWQGDGANERGVDKKTGTVLIEVSPKYYRPAEVDILIGDASKAEKNLGWKPKVTFKELVRKMVDWDLKHEVTFSLWERENY